MFEYTARRQRIRFGANIPVSKCPSDWLIYFSSFYCFALTLFHQHLTKGMSKAKHSESNFKKRHLTVLLSLSLSGELYVSDKCGSDGDGDGTEQKPFKTPLKVILKNIYFLITVLFVFFLPCWNEKYLQEVTSFKCVFNPFCRLCCLLERSRSRQSLWIRRRRERFVPIVLYLLKETQAGFTQQQKLFKMLRVAQSTNKPALNETELIELLHHGPLCIFQRWAVISKTQMKNTKKAFNREQMKNDAKDKKEVCLVTLTMRDALHHHFTLDSNSDSNKGDVMIAIQAEDNDRREKNLEEAKKITIEMDPSLPKPDTVGLFFSFLSHVFLWSPRKDTEGTKTKNFMRVHQSFLCWSETFPWPTLVSVSLSFFLPCPIQRLCALPWRIFLNGSKKCQQLVLHLKDCWLVCRLKSTSWRQSEVSGSKCLDGSIASEGRVSSVRYWLVLPVAYWLFGKTWIDLSLLPPQERAWCSWCCEMEQVSFSVSCRTNW